MRRVLRSFAVLALLTSIGAGCSDPTGPSRETLVSSFQPLANGAIVTSTSFTVHDNVDIPLTCLAGETTHWEGDVTVTIKSITPPTGSTQYQVSLSFAPDYYVERADGVRYYQIGPFVVNEHRAFGPVTVIAGTASGAWRSADGDVLVLGFHVSFVFDKDGNPVLDKWTGACP